MAEAEVIIEATMIQQMDTFIAGYFENFPYFKFTIATIVANWLLENYIDYRQRRQLRKKHMPESVKQLGMTQEQFESNNAYSLDRMTYGLVKGIYSLVKGLAFLYLFFWPAFWRMSKDLTAKYGYPYEEYPILNQIVYSSLSDLFSTIIGIPWGLYYDFVLEARWGFNKKTQWVFWTDIVKHFLVGLPLNSILISGLLKIIDWAGDTWFIFAWMFIAAFVFIMMWIYPTVIQPCFNKVEELESGDTKEGQVRASIEKLAVRIDYPLKQLYKIDGSKRSGHSNAYMYGFCNNKRIVLFDTLMDQMNLEQITAVLGHELGHWSHSHTIINLVKMQVFMFFGFFFLGFFLKDERMYAEFGFEDKVTLIGMSLASNLFNPLSSIMTFLNNYHTRVMEYQADRFGVNLGYGQALKEGLLVLVAENKKEMNPDWLYATYNYSHPAILERVAGIEDAMAKAAKKDT